MRSCGTGADRCTLCCRLLPVRAVNKPGGVKCQHQHSGGCRIYARLPVVAPECRIWNCAWLGDAAGDVRRPDRSHIVIDVMPDFVTITDKANGEEKQTLPAVQVWIDPKHREAHRDPALRAYLEDRGRQDGAVAIIRFSPMDGFVLFPPALTGGDWREHHTAMRETTHSLVEILEAARQRAIKSPPV